MEFAAKDLAATKQFFAEVFGWTFQDFGPEYSAFSHTDAGLDGGFYQADLATSTQNGGALIVFFTANLEETQVKIEQAKGKIVKPIFSFPGGRRFHFQEPSGNEFAAWSDKDPDK